MIPPRRGLPRIVKRLVRDLLPLAAIVVVTFMTRSSLADHYRVPSGSMQPTVEIDDRVVVHKAAYGLRLPWSDVWLGDVAMPERGDVVVLTSPEDGRVLLKRVVAVAGDVVEVRGGDAIVNGVVERRARLPGEGPPFGPARVPDDMLLVLGDNRGNSHDGRSFGFVSRRDVLGRAVAVYLRDGSLDWIRIE